MRRLWLALLGVALALPGAAMAEDAYPSRPITMIIPFPPGGVADQTARAIIAPLEKELKQAVAIRNVGGAGGAVGMAAAANAKPDGYTILLALSSISIIPEADKLFGRTPAYTVDQLKPIALLGADPTILVVRADAPWKTFQELMDYARANPGKVNYGTPGAGSSLHITMEQIAKAKGLKWTQVPFKGGADNMNALLGGHIDVTTDSTGWAELVNAGKFRLLVTWGAQRTKNWPNVPTLKEIGIDMVSNSPFGIGGPKGMDPAVVKVLHDAFRKGMEEQSYKDAMAKLDQEDFYLGTADYHAYAMKQIGEQKQLVEDLGLRQQ